MVGLKLLHSETVNTPSSVRDGGKYENKNEPNKLHNEIEVDADEESVPSRARMRKRQIEKDFQHRRSDAGTTMGSILIATESLKSDDDVEGQKTSLEVVEEQERDNVELLKCDSLSSEPEQKRSFMDQITTIFRPNSKQKPQVPRLQPVRYHQDDDSDLSFLSTPHSINNKLNSFNDSGRRGRTDDDSDFLPRGILKRDKCESPFSPVVYTNFTRNELRNHPSPGNMNIHVIDSPTAKGLKRFNTTTPKGYYHH